MTKETEIHGLFQNEYQNATVWLSINKSLFAQLMYSLVNEVSTGVVPTAATDCKKRLFDKKFCDEQTHKQLAGLMAHEIMHEMLMHQARRGDRDPRAWNYVADIKINNLLLGCGFELPAKGVFDHKGERFHNKSEEFIYDFIVEEEKKGNGGVPEGYEGDISSDELTENEKAQLQGRIQTAVEMHGMGNMSAEMQGAINTVLNPPEKWHEWMMRYFVAKTFSGCDWRQMCRREYVRSGIISPPFQSDSLGTVVWSVDQSGSISQEILDHVSGHLNSMMMVCRPDKIIVQYFDTKVHEVEEYTMSDLPITLKRVCGGGTDFCDAINQAETYDDVSVHVILTDMAGRFPDSTTLPTIWADFEGGNTAPFGEYIEIEMD